LRRNTARPSWNARRVSSSAEEMTERGESPLEIASRSQPSASRAAAVSSAMRPSRSASCISSLLAPSITRRLVTAS